MEKEGYSGLKHSKTHPKYLHTNSTSHVFPFGAIAELMDNSYDPDVRAKNFWVDVEERAIRGKKNVPVLVFQDDGAGMDPVKLHKMLSFGHCEKDSIGAEYTAVGQYGNGFKSGSMRLGKDALVLTKCKSNMSVGFLSQTFLEHINADDVLIPMMSFDFDGKPLSVKSDGIQSAKVITTFSFCATEAELMTEFEKINGTGTRIAVFNLRRDKASKQLELDFAEDEGDLRLATFDMEKETRRALVERTPNEKELSCDYSLRAYSEILYLKPRMKIWIRGVPVKARIPTAGLSSKKTMKYLPGNDRTKQVEIIFGVQPKAHREIYGMLVYHRNRLIRPYMRVGIQLQHNQLGVGVVGVVQADFLQPTHNKQEFDRTAEYTKFIYALGQRLKDYWFHHRKKEDMLPHEREKTEESDEEAEAEPSDSDSEEEPPAKKASSKADSKKAMKTEPKKAGRAAKKDASASAGDGKEDEQKTAAKRGKKGAAAKKTAEPAAEAAKTAEPQKADTAKRKQSASAGAGGAEAAAAAASKPDGPVTMPIATFPSDGAPPPDMQVDAPAPAAVNSGDGAPLANPAASVERTSPANRVASPSNGTPGTTTVADSGHASAGAEAIAPSNIGEASADLTARRLREGQRVDDVVVSVKVNELPEVSAEPSAEDRGVKRKRDAEGGSETDGTRDTSDEPAAKRVKAEDVSVASEELGAFKTIRRKFVRLLRSLTPANVEAFVRLSDKPTLTEVANFDVDKFVMTFGQHIKGMRHAQNTLDRVTVACKEYMDRTGAAPTDNFAQAFIDHVAATRP